MAKTTYKVSYFALYAIFAIIAVVLGLFYGVGYENPVGGYNSPEHTNTLIILMYALCGVTIGLAVIAGLVQFVAALRDNAGKAIKSLLGLVLLVAVIAVAYAMGSTEPIMANGDAYTDAFWLKITDMNIYAMYILMAVAGVACIVNMSGIFKR